MATPTTPAKAGESALPKYIALVVIIVAVLTWKGVISFSKDGKAGERLVNKFDQTNLKQEAREAVTRRIVLQPGTHTLEPGKTYEVALPSGKQYRDWQKPSEIAW